MANSVDPDETARAVSSGSTLFVYLSILVCRAEMVKAPPTQKSPQYYYYYYYYCWTFLGNSSIASVTVNVSYRLIPVSSSSPSSLGASGSLCFVTMAFPG